MGWSSPSSERRCGALSNAFARHAENRETAVSRQSLSVLTAETRLRFLRVASYGLIRTTFLPAGSVRIPPRHKGWPDSQLSDRALGSMASASIPAPSLRVRALQAFM